MKQTTEISIELTETVAYRLRDTQPAPICPKCGSSTPLDAREIAATLTRTEHEVYRSPETGEEVDL